MLIVTRPDLNCKTSFADMNEHLFLLNVSRNCQNHGCRDMSFRLLIRISQVIMLIALFGGIAVGVIAWGILQKELERHSVGTAIQSTPSAIDAENSI